MAELSVVDAVDSDIIPLQEGMSLTTAVKQFAEQDTFVYPVVSLDGAICGVLTFDMLKELMVDRDAWNWLVISDVMQPARHLLCPRMSLDEALQELRNNQIEAMPVVENETTGKLIGVLDQRSVRRRVGTELMRRQAVTV